MKRLISMLGLAALFIAVAGMTGDESKSVNLLLEATWMEDGEVEGGGIFVVRGEGTNGVISVDLPTPPPTEASDDPVELTWENVTYMEVEVKDQNDSLRTYGDADIETAAYVIEFEYEWDNSVIQKYLIRNNYDGDY